MWKLDGSAAAAALEETMPEEDEPPMAEEANPVGAGIRGFLCRRAFKPELDAAMEDEEGPKAATPDDLTAYEDAARGVTDDAALAYTENRWLNPSADEDAAALLALGDDAAAP
jgi:hypothetical protein